MSQRIEKDSMGDINVPNDSYYGAQSARSLQNFNIGTDTFPKEFIKAFGILKKACANANNKCNVLSDDKTKLINQAADEVINGQLNAHFPLSIWQTGSGTQTNMNTNEVIANRAIELAGGTIGSKTPIHPNDDCNKSQSSNDTFPTAMHIAAVMQIESLLLPSLDTLTATLEKKATQFKEIVKIGRTHLMDATPLTIGQEFSGYTQQLKNATQRITTALTRLKELAIGGTAVGTGLNTPKGYSNLVAKKIADFTGIEFCSAKNKFEALSANDAMVESHAAIKQIAVSLNKIANDIRLSASGPRSGIGELIIPANEPGSSIMPGKVNPTQVEAITMVCAQIFGNDLAITSSAMQGHLQLNVFKPVIAANFLQSVELLSDSCNSFRQNCISGIIPNFKKIDQNLNNSLMLITCLNNKLGYEKCAEIAKCAYKNGTTLKKEAVRLNYLSEKEFDILVDPIKMCNL